jgi:MFS family permease
LPAVDTGSRRVSVTQVLAKEHRRAALLVWLAFFASFATLYFLTSWIPKMAVDAGLTLETAIYAGASFNFGAVVGVLAVGWLATTGDLKRVVGWFFVLAFAAMLAMGFGMLDGGITTLLVMLFIIGAFVQGGFGGLYAVAASIYPAEIRTTGVGWSIGAGRLGAVVGPMLGGALIGAGASLSVSFAVFAVPMLIAAGAVLMIVRHAKASGAAKTVPEPGEVEAA